MRNSRLPIADCRLPTADYRLPTTDLPTTDCRLPTTDYRNHHQDHHHQDHQPPGPPRSQNTTRTTNITKHNQDHRDHRRRTTTADGVCNANRLFKCSYRFVSFFFVFLTMSESGYTGLPCELHVGTLTVHLHEVYGQWWWEMRT